MFSFQMLVFMLHMHAGMYVLREERQHLKGILHVATGDCEVVRGDGWVRSLG